MQAFRKKYESTLADLKTQQRSEGWFSHWQDLQRYFLPRRGQFLVSDSQKSGKKKHNNLVNNTPIHAANTLASGMMSGITSPARPWFKLTTTDADLAKFGPVKIWLEAVRNIMLDIYARSNVYKVLHINYRDLGVFGTVAMSLEEDEKELIRAFPYPIGSYYLALNDKLDVDVMYREIPLKVGQVVSWFGIDKVSDSVKSLFKKGNLFEQVNVVHLVEPNAMRDPKLLDNRNMAYRSAYYESSSRSDLILRESGFEEFPVMAPRWMTNGVDVYGSSPGMDALGDNRSMQIKEKRKDTQIDKQTDPPMVAPASLKSKYATLVPSDITFIDPSDGGANRQKFEPAQIIDPRGIGELRLDIQEQETRINKSFFVDLFLMISQMEGIQPRNELEILSRKEEKLLMLGPVLEGIQNDLLDPMIDRTFNIMERTGNMPPPPEELQGMDLKVEYISIMAQAQKAVGTTSLQETFSFVGQAAQLNPESVDKLDLDQAIDEFAAMKGTPPKAIRSDDDVAEIRAQRQQAQQAQQQQEAAAQAAQTAKTLSDSTLSEGRNVLNELVNSGKQG